MWYMQQRIFNTTFKRAAVLASAMCLVLLLVGCSGEENRQESTSDVSTGIESTESTDSDSYESQQEYFESQQEQSDIQLEVENEENMTTIRTIIDDTEVDVTWEDNESVDALKSLLESGEMTIGMSMYGGFEQVGSLGSSLPRNDVQTTTTAGDIVLYSSNQIVIFYGSNSWSYTRLGTIQDKTAEELSELLGNGDVTLTLMLS